MSEPAHPYHPSVWLSGDPTIGEGTWIGAFCVIDGSGGLEIGRGCDVSSGVQIYTHSSAKRCVSGRAYPEVERAPTTIGDHVFIGAGSIINMGVTIGSSSVIGAGSVVTKDIEPLSVVAGVPARVIGRVHLDGNDVAFEMFSAPVDTVEPSFDAVKSERS
ncbi:MAG: acyltransferase [Microthrixaceae bacterium]|nr:acyltransferase [Microthrixaceae bacterium]